jgi:hypothetical protein
MPAEKMPVNKAGFACIWQNNQFCRRILGFQLYTKVNKCQLWIHYHVRRLTRLYLTSNDMTGWAIVGILYAGL